MKKQVVSFSFGRSSAYLVIKAIEDFGADNVDIVSMDTGAEHPKTYEFARKVSSYILEKYNKKITCLRLKVNPELGKGNSYTIVDVNDLKPDLKPFTDMMGKYGVPYIGGMFCTDRMKLTPFKKYCNDTYGKNNYETWLGIRTDEPKRYLSERVVKLVGESVGGDDEVFPDIFKAMRLNDGDANGKYDVFNGMWTEPSVNDRANFNCKWDSAVDAIGDAYANKTRNNMFYMVEISDFGKEEVLNFWSKMPFDLGIDEWSGNCLFCPKKSNLKLAASQRDSPAEYLDYWLAIKSDSVRVDGNTGHYSKMYRGNQSLENLIATFDGSTGVEIKARIRGGKMTDTNSCSESCEVFQ